MDSFMFIYFVYFIFLFFPAVTLPENSSLRDDPGGPHQEHVGHSPGPQRPDTRTRGGVFSLFFFVCLFIEEFCLMF
jgi:hypothetical protein